MVLRESVNILKFRMGEFLMLRTKAFAVYIEFWFVGLYDIFKLFDDSMIL